MSWFSQAIAERQKKDAEKCLYYPSFYKENNTSLSIYYYKDHMNMGGIWKNTYKVVKIGYKAEKNSDYNSFNK